MVSGHRNTENIVVHLDWQHIRYKICSSFSKTHLMFFLETTDCTLESNFYAWNFSFALSILEHSSLGVRCFVNMKY